MPGYGISPEPEGMLSWEWASEHLARAENYWLSTTRPDGRPHCMPVWGVWVDNRFYFSTGPGSRKARNLAANAYCVIGAEPAKEAVVVEGAAAPVESREELLRIAPAYQQKYNEDILAHIDAGEGPLYRVTPRVVFAFTYGLPRSATRWVFA